MPELFQILREDILTELNRYQINIQNFLDKNEILFAFDIVKKIFKYKEMLSVYFSEIENICENIRNLLSEDFLHCCECLINIFSIEQTEKVDKIFSNVIIYLDYSNKFEGLREKLFSGSIWQIVQEKFEQFFQNLKENSLQFHIAFNQMNFKELDKTMIVAKRTNEILNKMKEYLSKDIDAGISYTDMIDTLSSEIKNLINRFDIDIIDNDEQRVKYIDEIQENSTKIRRILTVKTTDFQHVDFSTFDIKNLIETKIDTIANRLITYATKTELLVYDTDYFRLSYDILSSFEPHIDRSKINIQQVLQKFEDNICERVQFLTDQSTNIISDITKLVDLLIKLKYFNEKFSNFNQQINVSINQILNNFKDRQNLRRFKQLIVTLNRSDIGKRLINKYHYLNGNDWRNRWEKMRKQNNLDYVLNQLTGDDVDKNILATHYTNFQQTYETVKSEILRNFNPISEDEPHLEELTRRIKTISENINQKSNDYNIENFIQLITHLFVLWTFKNTQYYWGTNPYLFEPHIVQVIAVFRLLGIGYSTSRTRNTDKKFFINNLIEIGSGEGKSIVLAISACVFALRGFYVTCSCYSEILMRQDKKNFSSLFKILQLDERIQYKSFNRLCEEYFNQQGHIRENVRDMILNNKNMLIAEQTHSKKYRKVLLIDEFDVFFNKKYYGEMYTVSVLLNSPPIKMLLDKIWQEKTTIDSLDDVQNMLEYKTCANKYNNWMFIIDESIKDMLYALEIFSSSTYLVKDDKIVYIDNESIVENILYGYSTIWAYYYEYEGGNISQPSFKNNVGIIVNCGKISYAEIFFEFDHILGVSGSLKTLVELEKDILKRRYNIHRYTYIPSMFGMNQLSFNPMTDVHVMQEQEYFISIQKETDQICDANRAILIFFKAEEKLMTFYDSLKLSSRKRNVQIITEKVPAKQRELRIECATNIGTITLLTRIFSRGIDFICRDQQLSENGGIHVVQTFFSKKLSEEYQIRRRGGRQGDKGSYKMILLDRDLEWVLGPTWQQDLPKIKGPNLYSALDKARKDHYERRCNRKHRNIDDCKSEHDESLEFISALYTGELDTVEIFLSKQNEESTSAQPDHPQFYS